MIVIDGKNAVMGRMASFTAKEALKGEEIAIVNCGEVIITGSKKFIEGDIQKRREMIGSGQKGPKISRTSEKIVKRAIRGMLPDHRLGRGKEAFKRIKCYVGVPPEFKDSKKITFNHEDKLKYIKVKELEK
ncbi:MAG: 50S ribosomal protein L13 [Nanoarchaeota archaeon]